jgi:hypothetical protein
MSPGSTPKTKLAPRSRRPPPGLTAVEERAFAFAEDVLKQAIAIVDAAIAEVAFERNATDPKLYALALLCRSISNFQGALTMARNNQAVECRTQARSCFENLFLVDQLRQHGAGFVTTMHGHEAWGKISLGERSLKHGDAESPQAPAIRELIKRERVVLACPMATS